jgi:hypothetical protein
VIAKPVAVAVVVALVLAVFVFFVVVVAAVAVIVVDARISDQVYNDVFYPPLLFTTVYFNILVDQSIAQQFHENVFSFL